MNVSVQTRGGLFTLFLVMYMTSIFIQHRILDGLLAATAVLSLIVSFKGGGRVYQTISIVFLLLGGILALLAGGGIRQFLHAFTTNALLVSLLYVLPFMNHIMIAGRYDRQILSMLKANVRNARQLYVRTSILTYALSLFIFLSAIPTAFRTVKDLHIQQSAQFVHRFASRVILRTFSAATVWSPVEVFIAVAVAATKVSYITLFPWLIGFSVFMLLLDWIWNLRLGKTPISFARKPTRQLQLRPLAILFAVLFLFIFSGYSLSRVLHTDFFDAVILLIIPFTLIWSLLIGRFKRFVAYNRLAWSRHLGSMQNFVLLFVSLGVFSAMVQQTDWIVTAQEALLGKLAAMPLVLFLLMQMVSLTAALLGLHPLVTLSLMGVFIQPLLTVLNPVSLAIVLLTANLANDSSGTFNTTVTLMSEQTGENPYRITARNIGYALVYGWAGVALGYLLL
ncbi:hypothetical protein DUZ99_18500 [Xylanibacillus composti]|uniref:Uncharacterized protein n=1 Tax=Xylanibacillus composti TaxID=1572762 RepID=A0A8J4M318_9BACL|nr:hypothetical protein [Xylanibacillus composti]MDT9726961.1 hypothetical protein [Xylanibacillus composti]GIQ69517.1 hypothetical protein XYCOK13_23410 [Xylanibacillus composti]